MTETKRPSYALTDEDVRTIRKALRDYAFETARYITSTGYEPCAPECVHCAPRVEHFAHMQADLQRRADQIEHALDALMAPAGKGSDR